MFVRKLIIKSIVNAIFLKIIEKTQFWSDEFIEIIIYASKPIAIFESGFLVYDVNFQKSWHNVIVQSVCVHCTLNEYSQNFEVLIKRAKQARVPPKLQAMVYNSTIPIF